MPVNSLDLLLSLGLSTPILGGFIFMSKRFIDTGLFEDSWFMDLSKDGKLLWIYMITKCDHAGIIELNKKLLTVQTEIKDFSRVIEELGNRLVTLDEELNIYFIPKFIHFQYPNFPQSKVNQQQGAIKQLEKYGLFVDGKLVEFKSSPRVKQELTNSYGNGNDNGNDIGSGKESLVEDQYSFENFWNLYNKKVDRQSAERKYSKLKESEKEKIFETIPAYIKSTPDPKYRKNPDTYLNNRSWEDEIIIRPVQNLRPH